MLESTLRRRLSGPLAGSSYSLPRLSTHCRKFTLGCFPRSPGGGMGHAPHGGPMSYLCQGTVSVRAAQMSGLVSIPASALLTEGRSSPH